MAKKSLGNNLGIIIAILLVIGVVMAGIAVQQSTNNEQHASQANDLNTASEITTTNNPDGTMGPESWWQNYSNTLPQSDLGNLNLQVADPVQGKRPTDVPPTHTLPTQAQGHENERPSGTPGAGNQNQFGPQTVTSLVLTINKVEVHLATVASPGEKVTPPVSPQDQSHGRPSGTPGAGSQNVDKWEVLNIGGVQTVDLVALAKTQNFSSLGITKLAGGLYTELRLYVKSATATLSDGTKVTLTMPGRANIVRIVEPFVIVSGKTTTLSMYFDAQNSVIKAGNLYLLKPVVARFNRQNQQ